MSAEGPVLFDVEGGVATITINRPEARNALNMEVKRGLGAAVAEAGACADVRALVLTGAGGAFCAGGDIGEMVLNDSPVTSRARLAWLLDEVVIPLAELEKPTIAAVEGHAHGAGLSLALACDLMVVAEDALLSCAFAGMGLVPDCGALYFLPRRLPMGIAKDLVLTGRRICGAEAGEMQLASRVTSPGTALMTARELASTLAGAATVALGLSKKLLEAATTSTLREMAELEAFGQSVAYASEDHRAAREAFAAKVRPIFTGR